jgi:preprotein translocase subunit SecD
MEKRNNYIFILILVLVALVIWVDVTNTIQIGSFTKNIEAKLGLDLQGGLQVLMEVDKPADYQVDAQSLQDAKKILENRSNGLGVSEVVFQIAGNRRIVGEFPGLTNTQDVIAVLKETGELEFLDMGSSPLPEGTIVKTDSGSGAASTSPAGTATSEVTPTEAAASSATPTATPAGTVSPTDKIYHSVMSGADLKSVSVGKDNLGKYYISFVLSDNGKKLFGDYTRANVGKYLAISLDKKLISVPVIETAITDGSGQISGKFTADEANNLAVQLRYGSLPVPLKVVQSDTIGPTLGQDSVRKSEIAGIIGLTIVMLFMLLYYRVPGLIADIALAIYALTTFALYKLIPVTLTLPGIAGFVLSIGMAVDANILIFERLKEELLAGRNLRQAIDLGWKRAWTSIRDSNISTLITCIILFWFGNAYGASIVKGFSLTLALGVLVSMFTAIIVTRTILHVALDNLKFIGHTKWFGL